MLSMSMRGK